MTTFREMAKQVDDKLEKSNLSIEELAKKSESLNFEPDLFAKFQELKSLKATMGEIDAEVAQEIYSILGESCQGFNKRSSIGTKYVMLTLFQKMIA
jgi:hypothetical protein